MTTRNGVRLLVNCAVTILIVTASCGVACAAPLSCGGTYTLKEVFTQGVNGNAQFIENDPFGVIEFCAITISDYKFVAAGSHGNVVFTSPDEPNGSDLLVLYNNTLNQAVICFSSDGTRTPCNKDTSAGAFNVNYAGMGTYKTTIDAVSTVDKKKYSLTVSASSDVKEVFGGQSDMFTITAAPEPSSMLLMGSGILGLSGLLRRRRMPHSFPSFGKGWERKLLTL